MTKIAIPDGCRGIDDPRTGRTYRPKHLKSGYVEVNDPAFAKAAKRELGEVGTSIFAGASMPTWSCTHCCRTNWETDKKCVRCGRDRSAA